MVYKRFYITIVLLAVLLATIPLAAIWGLEEKLYGGYVLLSDSTLACSASLLNLLHQ